MKTSAQIGNVGINTTTPQAMLHVKDSSVLFSGPASLASNPGPPPVTGLGNRMMWYADKSAFRAGGISMRNWDMDSTGNYSIAAGWDTKAKGIASVALGHSTAAIGHHSFAVGYYTSALLQSGIAFGESTTSEGQAALAAGSQTYSSGFASTAIGSITQATGYGSLAAGWYTKATTDEAVALNTSTQANGNSSTALGLGTISNGSACLAIGRYNDPMVSPVTDYLVSTYQPLFIIGNGENDFTKSNAMVVRYDGQIGIGTNDPGCRLEVHEPSSNSYVARFVNGGGTSNIRVANQAHEVELGVWDDHGYVGSKDGIGFVLRTGGFGRVFIDHPTGHVGIGTWPPQYRLDVLVSDTSEQVASFKSTGGYGEVTVGNSTHRVDIGASQNFGYMGTKEDLDLVLRTGTIPRIRIQSGNGFVGIGSANPMHKLHVSNFGYNNVISKFQNSGGYCEINVDNSEGLVDFGVAGTIGYIGTKAEGDFYLRTNGFARMMIQDETGNVGIGTFNPAATLEVNGTAMKPGGGSWTASSDARLKQNVVGFNDGLDAILAIRPVTYQYNSLSGYDTSASHIGVIAQELQAIAPYMVSVSEKELKDGSAGYLEVDNGAMVYLLINAVKEQQQMIEELQEKVLEMRGERR